ncbi:MAG TPA: hypothetical protein VKE88_00965 [Candidatus Nanoarchaeia archaeon]|nr:hypothetical protein [Candidatus Nanoarchaeia archaeon]
MTVIGFTFKKIFAERGPAVTGKVNISNNVALKKVEEAKVPVGNAKQKALRFSYEYITTYTPNIGSITIEGDVLYLTSDDAVEKTLKSWKAKKQVEKELLAPVLNMILGKCTLKGLNISQDLGLPSPVQLPKINVK